MKKAFISLALVISVSLGGWIGASLWRKSGSQLAPPSARKVLFYQDSMHPWIKSDHPAKCTVCGMDLTPISEGQQGFGPGDNVVALNSNSITVLNVQTEEVKAQGVGRTLRVAGTLEANENRKTVVAAPAAGRIDDLSVRYPGVEVREGERLATFYSPELTLEKRRFLVRSRMSVQRDPTGGLAQPQADSDPYYSDLICPQSGTVVERKVYKGQYVSDGERLFTIVDLSELWFRFDVYEQQFPWLAPGQTIEVSVPSVPGRLFTAVIAFIEPMINEATRTFKVRADLKNPLVEINGRKQRLLGLGVYAEGKVRAELKNALTVPRAAVLSPGGSAFAYVDKGNGAYEKRPLKLGHQGDSIWEVLEGVEPGEHVVTSGGVLMDAQAQFNHAGRAEEAGARGAEPARMSGEAQPEQAIASAPVPPAEEKMERESMPAMKAEKKTVSPGKRTPRSDLHAAQPSRPATLPTTWAPGRRGPMQAPADTGGPSFRNSRLTQSDTMTAVFNRVAELRGIEAAEAAKPMAPSQPALTEAQVQKLQALVVAADGISRSLAEDNLGDFKNHHGQLGEMLASLDQVIGPSHPLSAVVQRLRQASPLQPAKDLAEARKQFLPFSTAMVELAKQVRREDTMFVGLKIYHCPMAPKPGLWMQAKGPLANPFYGAEMLRCGEEVKPEGDLALRQTATPK